MSSMCKSQSGGGKVQTNMPSGQSPRGGQSLRNQSLHQLYHVLAELMFTTISLASSIVSSYSATVKLSVFINVSVLMMKHNGQFYKPPSEETPFRRLLCEGREWRMDKEAGNNDTVCYSNSTGRKKPVSFQRLFSV